MTIRTLPQRPNLDFYRRQARDLLRLGPYARPTKNRIAGEHGHLSNEALADFVRAHLGARVRCLVLVHVSRVNNVPELAEMTCREALAACGRGDVDVIVARQDRVTRTVDLGVWHEPLPLAAARGLGQPALPFN